MVSLYCSSNIHLNITLSLVLLIGQCIMYIYFLSALILEEIAIDNPIRQKEEEILKEAQELHLASLGLARYTVNDNKLQVQ